MSEFQKFYIHAGQLNITKRELALFAYHNDHKVRTRVAEHLSTPIEALRQLSDDPNIDVRAAVASNPNTPIDLQLKLAGDNDPTVRFSLAEDHNTPLVVLTMLAGDENPFVSCRAIKTAEAILMPKQSTAINYQTAYPRHSQASNRHFSTYEAQAARVPWLVS